MKPELPLALLAPPRGLTVWWAAIRPRTLTIAVAPVAVGSVLAYAEGTALAWLPMLVALGCALLIQIGTNLHNDAADFERGTDGPERVGPLRVTSAGWASSANVRRASAASFGSALLLGGYLVAVGGWPILLVGLASLAAGWAYSGGPWPISHTPLGEVFVLLFFGLIAVGGSHWLQSGAITPATLIAGIIVGLPAAAVLLVNNYRDVEADSRSGRRTLAATLGPKNVQRLYVALMVLPLVLALVLEFTACHGAAACWLALPLVRKVVVQLKRSPVGPELNRVLAETARAGFVLNIMLTFGIGLFAARVFY